MAYRDFGKAPGQHTRRTPTGIGKHMEFLVRGENNPAHKESILKNF